MKLIGVDGVMLMQRLADKLLSLDLLILTFALLLFELTAQETSAGNLNCL